MTTDNTAIALVPVVAHEISDELHRIADQARDDAAHALAPSTLHQYAIKFQAWSEWATRHGFSALPAQPEHFALHLSDLAWNGAAGGKRRAKGRTGQSLSSLRQAVAAIQHFHREAKLDEFASKHRAVKNVLAGLSRKRAEAPLQAEPLTPELLGRILDWLAARRDPWSIRDAAMLALGYAAARRRSELVGLDLDEMGATGDGFLQRHHDRLEVTLVRHKTKGAADEPLVFPVPRQGNRALVAAVDRWLKTAKVATGEPIFRRIDRHRNITGKRLKGDTVSPVIKRRIKQFLIEVDGVDAVTAKQRADGFSGHSMRVGLATSAANAGADVSNIMAALGHASPAMSIRYAKRADKMRNSVHNLAGVGLDGVTKSEAV